MHEYFHYRISEGGRFKENLNSLQRNIRNEISAAELQNTTKEIMQKKQWLLQRNQVTDYIPSNDFFVYDNCLIQLFYSILFPATIYLWNCRP